MSTHAACLAQKVFTGLTELCAAEDKDTNGIYWQPYSSVAHHQVHACMYQCQGLISSTCVLCCVRVHAR